MVLSATDALDLRHRTSNVAEQSPDGQVPAQRPVPTASSV